MRGEIADFLTSGYDRYDIYLSYALQTIHGNEKKLVYDDVIVVVIQRGDEEQ
jgi:hypothetical protein